MIAVFPEIKALIFDCDGTLADTLPIQLKAWCDTFADFGLECPVGFIRDHQGIPVARTIEMYNRQFHTSIDSKAFAEQKNQRAHAGLVEARPIVPVANIVKKYRGVLPMAVASGGTRRNVDLIIATIGMDDCFDAVITSDDAVAPKPSPDIFLEAARRMQVEPRFCQVFEDGDAGLVAAEGAGMIGTDVRPFLNSI